MNLLQSSGAQPQKQPKYVPIFIDRAFTGIWTQRNVLHDPSDLATYRFYGGRPDALVDGSNVELTNLLTLGRRPGHTPFSIATYPTAPDRAFSFSLTNGTIQVIIDTGSTPTFNMTGVQVISGVSYYFFSSPQSCAANNSYEGLKFLIAGFTQGVNNGTYVCIGSTSTYLILQNPLAVTDASSGTAVSSGAIWYDQQNNGPSYPLSAVNVVSDVVYYLFTTSQAAALNNGFAGQFFVVTGFDKTVNNGTFECIASTDTYMILENVAAVTDVHSGLATSTDKVLLFAKSPGAGQTYFVAVAGVLYMGDGVDVIKYTPGNINGTIWDWGTAAPKLPPGVVITPSGSAATQWVANTVFSTMGLIIDPDGNVQQLNSVNALGNNPAPATLGTSGNGTPNLGTAVNQTTLDGSVTWTSLGPITLWKANTLYQPGQPIYDPNTNCIFIMSHTTAESSGATKPNFNSTLGLSGVRIDDTSPGTAKWENLGVVNGSPTAVKTWTKATHFNQFTLPSSGIDPMNVNSAIVYPTIPTVTNLEAYAAGTGPAIYLLGATSPGTTSAANYTPWTAIPPPPAAGSQSAGAITTPDGQLSWLCLGSGAWAPNTLMQPWSAFGQLFSVIVDSNNNFQVCTTPFGQSSITGSVEPTAGGTGSNPWGQGYGSLTMDGTVTWTCVGPSLSWTANTQWNLPLLGFSPPGTSQPFGGSEVIGNSFVQAVISSGLSGSSTPAWGTPPTIGNTVNDNTIIWKTASAYTQQSLSWTKGHVYAYSYAARLASDPFNLSIVDGGDGPPPGYFQPLGAPKGSLTGLISTSSPVFTITGPNSGAVNTISGVGSPDPQVDTIIIWRDADGGGPDNMFFLTEIPAPPPNANGTPGTWSFQDFLPDLPTSQFPGLNELIPAPIDDENDPPPSTFLPMVYNFQRIWGANGSNVPFSGGPDVITGNPNEAFNPADNFPYLAPVIRVVKNSQGLVIFITDTVEFIGGGPLTSSFYSVTLAPGIGLLSYNALDLYAGEIYFLSADGQFKIINPALTLSTAGFAIGDKLQQINPSLAYVACQQAGVDNAIYVSDGEVGWWRCNPHQVPGALNGPEPIWSPFATILANSGSPGLKLLQSVEVAPGIKKLLVGGTQCNLQILERNLNVFTDNGTQYDAFFIMGSIMLAHPGQLALLKFIEGDFSGQSYQPRVSFMLNEIVSPPGVFVNMPLKPVFDPPQLYGTTITPASYSPNRYYFASTGTLARCRHLQIKVDFGTTPNNDQIFNLTIFGRLMVEL